MFKLLTITQGAYILITGLWPIFDIESFVLVTGPKTDIWLVKTVGALLLAVAVAMFLGLWQRETTTVSALGAGTAIAFIVIDVYYATNDVISSIYLADVAVEAVFLVAWIIFSMRKNNNPIQSPSGV